MGLFGKKKVEDLEAMIEEDEMMSQPPIKVEEKPSNNESIPPPVPEEVVEKEETKEQEPEENPLFAIDDAVELIRQLPSRNIDLVMQVVKKTLESVKVSIADLIAQADERGRTLDNQIGTLKNEIENLEQEISTKKKEIGDLQGQQKEVNTVSERLSLAQKLDSQATDSRSRTRFPSDKPAPAKNDRSTTPNDKADKSDKPDTTKVEMKSTPPPPPSE